MRRLILDHALLPDGWARNVGLDIEDGIDRRRRSRTPPPKAASASPAIALPGLPNLHSHAFQRGMAGLAETRGPAGDSFWTWREVMYRFLGPLTPDDVEAIAAFAMMEMLEGGFTALGRVPLSASRSPTAVPMPTSRNSPSASQPRRRRPASG